LVHGLRAGLWSVVSLAVLSNEEIDCVVCMPLVG